MTASRVLNLHIGVLGVRDVPALQIISPWGDLLDDIARARKEDIDNIGFELVTHSEVAFVPVQHQFPCPYLVTWTWLFLIRCSRLMAQIGKPFVPTGG